MIQTFLLRRLNKPLDERLHVGRADPNSNRANSARAQRLAKQGAELV
jgi:hypothetical protein